MIFKKFEFLGFSYKMIINFGLYNFIEIIRNIVMLNIKCLVYNLMKYRICRKFYMILEYAFGRKLVAGIYGKCL